MSRFAGIDIDKKEINKMIAPYKNSDSRSG